MLGKAHITSIAMRGDTMSFRLKTTFFHQGNPFHSPSNVCFKRIECRGLSGSPLNSRSMPAAKPVSVDRSDTGYDTSPISLRMLA